MSPSKDDKIVAELAGAMPAGGKKLNAKRLAEVRRALADAEDPEESSFSAGEAAEQNFSRLPLQKETRGTDFTYYRVEATHERFLGARHRFVGVVQWARWTLPEREADVSRTWNKNTAVGRMLRKDHYLHSVEAVNARFADEVRRKATRVDLMAPGRKGAHRFAAGALYLCYDDDGFAWFVAEGGSALGNNEALYPGFAADEWFGETAQFSFTAFASPKHTYAYRLQMDAAGEHPDTLEIRVFEDPEMTKHALTNTLSIRPLTREELEATGWFAPASQFAVAANRVLDIGEKMPPEMILSKFQFGMTRLFDQPKRPLAWEIAPERVDDDS